jgi:hypothetical protein
MDTFYCGTKVNKIRAECDPKIILVDVDRKLLHCFNVVIKNIVFNTLRKTITYANTIGIGVEHLWSFFLLAGLDY